MDERKKKTRCSGRLNVSLGLEGHKTRLSTVIQQLPQLLRLFTWTTSSAFHL
jgi:hypothetical protein